jgi:LacI family transcriptional regulator
MPKSAEPKYVSIARAVETSILSDQQNGTKVPSTRDIAEEHGVSIVTASRALQVLRDKGLIETVSRTRSFLAAKTTMRSQPGLVHERYAVLLRSTPGLWQLSSRSSPLAGFVAAAGEQPVTLEIDPFKLDGISSLRALDGQVRRAVDLGIKGLFLMPSRHDASSALEDELLVRACKEHGIAVVLVERNLRGRDRPLEHDLVATDDVDGGLVSTRHLIEQGRRRVAFITGSPTSSHEGRVAGYLTALFHATASNGSSYEPLVLEQRSGLPTREAFEELADRVVSEKFDGAVCYQDYTALGLIIELLTRGIRIPEEVALTGFDNLAIGNSFAIGVTTYDYPALPIARQAIAVMRARSQDPTSPPIKVLVPGKLIMRESSCTLVV